MLDREATTRYIHGPLQSTVGSCDSDLFITAEFPPATRAGGKVTPISQQPLNAQQALGLVKSIVNEKQLRKYEDSSKCDFAITAPGAEHFRMSASIWQDRAGMVLRTINTKILTLGKLDLPPILNEITMSKHGPVIVVGAAGPGKPTSLAVMVDYRNANSYGHIIIIKDPAEYVHVHQNRVATQREMGVDTRLWHVALENTLRQAPDVILISEIRDRDMMEYATQCAETDHLCLTMLHTSSSSQAIDRIINLFPEEKRQRLLIDLSLNLRTMIAQRLLPCQDRKGCVPAVEIMLATPPVQGLVFKGEVHELKEVIKKSHE